MDMLLVSEQVILLAVLVTAGMAVQTATGFGANLVIISLGMGAGLMPLHELVAVILPANVLQSLIIAIRQGHLARWRLLFRRILPAMGVGVVCGLLLASVVTGEWAQGRARRVHFDGEHRSFARALLGA